MTKVVQRVSKFKKVSFSIAVAVLTVLFIHYGIEVFYPASDRDCYSSPVIPDKCGKDMLANETFEKECRGEGGLVVYDESGCSYECYPCVEEMEKRDGRIFLFLVIFSGALLVGGILVKPESLGNGFVIASLIQLGTA